MRVSICLSQEKSARTLKYLLDLFLLFLFLFLLTYWSVWTDNQSRKETISFIFIKSENWSSFWWSWENQRAKIFFYSTRSLRFSYWTRFKFNIIVFFSSFAMKLINKNSILLNGKSLCSLSVFKVKFFSFITKMSLFLLEIFLSLRFDKIFFIIINELQKFFLNFSIMLWYVTLIQIKKFLFFNQV